MTYQDVIVDGEVVRKGSRECASRWDAISGDIEGFGFTVLDLGAYTGYFTKRFVEEFDAKVVAVDNNKDLRESLEGFDVKVINERLAAEQIHDLGKFDVVLALSVLHHMPDWRDVLEVLVRNADCLYVEIPDVTENLPKAISHTPELIETVEGLGGRKIAETAGHRSEIRRGLWAI